MITAVVCRVGQEPTIEQVGESIDDMHDIVGGYFQAVGLAGNIVLWCNEDGISLSLPFNRCGILGDFFITATKDENNASLTEEECRKAIKWCEIYKNTLHYSGPPKIVFAPSAVEFELAMQQQNQQEKRKYLAKALSQLTILKIYDKVPLLFDLNLNKGEDYVRKSFYSR